jgi:hypothetical protein
MSNSIKEYYKLDVWLNAKYSTFGNIQNNFTSGLSDPANYDYIFYKSNMERVTYISSHLSCPSSRSKFSTTTSLQKMLECL